MIWFLIVGGIALLIAIGLYFLSRKKDKDIDLDSRLSGVKNFWDACCKKMKGGFGV